MTAIDRLRDHWRDQGLAWKDGAGDTASAQAPGHSPTDRSITFRQIAGQVLMNSHADDKDAVLAELGLKMADLFDDPKGASYSYSDGRTVFRTPTKKFRQAGNTQGSALYRAELLAEHQTGIPVYVVEGEKDVHALESVGAVAVCSAMGAGKAAKFDWSPLTGHTVVIVADNDEPGLRHATDVLEIVEPIAEAVVMVQAATGKDAADHIAAGHGLDEFQVVDSPTAKYAESAELPTPLDRAVDLLDFPVDALPESIAAMVRTVAESSQVNAGMAGAMALGALSAAAGGYVEVEPRVGYREPVNVWPLVIAEPGERKSSVSEAMAKPLHDLEQVLAEQKAPLVAEAQTLKEIAEKAAEKAKRDAGNAADADKRIKLTADATGLAAAAAEMTVPSLPRIIADDVTPEAMVSLLADQGGKLAIISAEGGLFNTFAGRYDSNPDLSAFLKAHAGDRIRVDRKGRPSEFINSPALTLALMIQPGVLATASGNKLFHDSGLMARFLYAWPTSRVGHREVDTQPLDQAAQALYAQTVTDLATRLRARDDVQVLTLTDDADAERLRYAREVESRLADGADLAHIRGWASKVVGAAIRIAGLIHVTESRSTEISVEAMRAGVRFAEYFTTHALHVFDGMARGSDERAMARRIMKLVERRGPDKFGIFSERDLVTTSARSWLPTIDDARPALNLLVEFGWIEPVEPEERSGRGRRPSPKYRVHPSVWSAEPSPQNTRNTQNQGKRTSAVSNSADIADIADRSAAQGESSLTSHNANSADIADIAATPEHLCKVCDEPCNPRISAHVECLVTPPAVDPTSAPIVHTPGRKPGQWLGSGDRIGGDAA
ncbi:DUF3987 domain-containing protein [Rhodococcus sp. NPDC127530]|uniref:DUF3987 domain-containing protein n=1 Tax=unclassified Rhodococcus (in: high G+C Gram-positive bacteria) TaxID=192944 RepID=UPI00362CFE29